MKLDKLRVPVLFLPLFFLIVSFFVVLIVAQFGNLPGFCGFIINRNARNACYENNLTVAPGSAALGKNEVQEPGNSNPADAGILKPSDPDLAECDKKKERVIPSGVELKSYELGYRDDCYVSVAEKKQDESICEKIKTPYFKDECYLLVGQASLDYKICDKSGGFRDQCYERVNQSDPNITTCEKITNRDYKERCYVAVAFAEKNESICGKIESNDDYWLQRDYCYAKVAVSKHDESLCAGLKIQARNYCYADIGAFKGDLSICDKIEDTQYTDWKNRCYKVVNNPN